MKIAWYIITPLLLFLSCSNDDNSIDYKQKMRQFVIGISQYAKAIKPNFFIIPQNGIELVTVNGDATGQPHTEYLNAIDGNGQEDLFYGYENDDQPTPSDWTSYIIEFLNISKNAGNTILVTDYCSTHANMDDSYVKNFNAGYISFAANHRELDNIPDFPNPIYRENSGEINNLSDAKNFLYLINTTNYASKADFINAITATNYDVIIIDLFFKDGTSFTSAEITQLKNKANGGKRIVIAYMSIGEAENYRYYWQSSWNTNRPGWLDAENPNWPGNYKVRYWDPEWQQIIFGNDSSYLKKIADANFDGVYLDIIDAFEYFER